MKKYLGVKLVHAEPMSMNNFSRICKGQDVSVDAPDRDGYKVVYGDGYTSWSPKEVFEKAYRESRDYDSILIDVNTNNGDWDYASGLNNVYTDDSGIVVNPGELVDFGKAIESLKKGKRISREGWNGKGLFVFKQVPANVGIQYVPNMQSLPQDVKDEFVKRGENLNYSNQMCIVKHDNTIDSWVPSSSDVFAEDWCILD